MNPINFKCEPKYPLLTKFNLCTFCSGPLGRDIGLALSFPFGCMIAHSLNGQAAATASIEVYTNGLLDAYCSRMAEAGKTPEELASILRHIAGWCGWFQYLAFYILNVQDSFPVGPDTNRSRHHDALGVLGLKLMRLAYDTDYAPISTGPDEMREKMFSLVEEEVSLARDAFASEKRRIRPRKSSMLRATNRRISDTEMFYFAAESAKRFSVSEEG